MRAVPIPDGVAEAMSADGRLTVQRYTDSTVMMVGANGLLSVQQVFDALYELLPPPIPTAREVALATLAYGAGAIGVQPFDLARRWDQGGQP